MAIKAKKHGIVNAGLALLATLSLGSLAEAQQIEICFGNEGCAQPIIRNSLQAALDEITSDDNYDRRAYISLPSGWHTNSVTATPRSIVVTDWLQSCTSRSGRTGFVLDGREAFTRIQGASEDPSETRIWARIPDDLLDDPGAKPNLEIFHGLAVINSTSRVDLKNLSLISDGGLTENGAADASLYIGPDSEVRLDNTIVMGNKTASNCQREYNGNTFVPDELFFAGDDLNDPIYLDQHGVTVDGGLLRSSNSVVGGNIHTGVMVLNGGRYRNGHRTLIRGNGWDGQIFQDGNKGHGVTTFWNEGAASCLDGDNQIWLIGSKVVSNTGHGAYLRGNFGPRRANHVSDNDILNNQLCGTALDGGPPTLWSYFFNWSRVSFEDNNWGASGDQICIDRVHARDWSRIYVDDQTDVLVGQTDFDATSGIQVNPQGIFPGSNWDGKNADGIDLWSSLLSVVNALSNQTRSCT